MPFFRYVVSLLGQCFGFLEAQGWGQHIVSDIWRTKTGDDFAFYIIIYLKQYMSLITNTKIIKENELFHVLLYKTCENGRQTNGRQTSAFLSSCYKDFLTYSNLIQIKIVQKLLWYNVPILVCAVKQHKIVFSRNY